MRCRRLARRAVLSAVSTVVVATGACGGTPAIAPAALTHEVYVWQRAWTGAVRDAVAHAPPELGGLRVLALEIDGAQDIAPDVAVDALIAAHRPITAVVRIDGSRPIAGLSLAPLLGRITAWQHAGVDVIGVEIDHDCATTALADYAAWLTRARVPAPLRWSITALPTWAESPALATVAAAVDDLVVQVHAIRAPSLFDARQARRWTEAFARAIPGHPFRVAVPTYRVVVDGEPLQADPISVAGFVRELERHPVAGVHGVVWFRLPVDSDVATWRTATLRAAIADAPLAPQLHVRTIERQPAVGRQPGVFDVVLANDGTLDAPYPALRLAGALASDLVAGYRSTAEPARWTPPDRVIAAGSQVVIGWATGQELTADVD